MRRLSDIGGAAKAKRSKKTPSIHICGEAYSDYHGFIEGSLRSAVYVLHRILDLNLKGDEQSLSWLEGDEDRRKERLTIAVEQSYLRHLRVWAKYLDDEIPSNENFADEDVDESMSCVK